MTSEEIIRAIRNEIEKQIKDPQEHCYGVSSINKLRELLDFIDTLESEKPVPADLEEAADEMAIRAFPEKKSYSTVIDRVVDYNAVDRKNYRDGIIAGAKWQADHTPLPEDSVIYQKGVEEGKRLMMDEAVEGYVNYYEDSGGILMAEAQVGCPYHNGDKVRVIIIKE